MPYADVGEVTLYYEIHGAGPRILFFNGTNGDLRQKPSIFDSPLGRYFEILAFDQRGLGRSDKPDGPYTMAQYAHDAAQLLNRVGWDGCLVVGISFGGMVAQEFAVTYPSRVQRLVLGVTSSGGEGGASYPLHELWEIPASDRALALVKLFDTRQDDAWIAAHPEIIKSWSARSPVAMDPQTEKGLQNQLQARRYHDAFARLPALTMPVYVFGGRYDGIAPPERALALAHQISHAQCDIWDHGRVSWLQDQLVWKRIIEFLLDGNG